MKIIMSIIFLLFGGPFILILLFAEMGANDCKDNILQGLPNAVQGDTAKVNDAAQKYCDANTGNFQYVKKVSDWTAEFYPGYVPFALIISIILIVVGSFSSRSN